MDHSKSSLEKYKRILEERYQALLTELDGVEPIHPREGWGGSTQEYKESHRLVRELDLRLAADDLINALKEVKKLK